MLKLKSLIESKWSKDLSKVWAFWMSPEGELIHVEDDGCHLSIAQKILKDRYGINISLTDWTKDIRKLMYDKGWRDVSPATIRDKRRIYVTPNAKLTRNQLKTLEDLAINSGRSVYFDTWPEKDIFILPDDKNDITEMWAAKNARSAWRTSK